MASPPVTASDDSEPKIEAPQEQERDAPTRIANSLPWIGIGIGLLAICVVLLARYVTYFWTQRHEFILFVLKQFFMATYALLLLLTIFIEVRRHTRTKTNWKKLIASGCTAFMVLITVFMSPEPRVSEDDFTKVKSENADVMDPPLTVTEGNTLIAQGIEMSRGNDLIQAQGALALKDYQKAIRLFDRGMGPLTTELADAHFYKARALWASAGDDLSRYGAALDEVNLSLVLRPRFSPALVIQCACLRNLVTRPNYLEDARISCEGAIKADSKNPAAYNAMGGVLVSLKQFDAAIASFDQGIRFNADVPQLWGNRAVAVHRRAQSNKQKPAEPKKAEEWKAQKRAEELKALDDVNHALRLAPKFRDGLLNRATIYKALGDIQLARNTYETLVQEDPNDAYAWNNLGDAIEVEAKSNNRQAESAKADLPAALFAFNQALRVNASFEDALYNKGDALNQLGKYREAIEPLEAACKIDPSDNDARAQLAFSYSKTGRTAEALAVAKQVITRDPKNAQALQVLRGARHR